MKREDFPEWTPPINGWEYRFTHVETDRSDRVTFAHTLLDYEVQVLYDPNDRGETWKVLVRNDAFSLTTYSDKLEEAIGLFEQQLAQLKQELEEI